MALRVMYVPSSGSNVDLSTRLRASTAVITSNAEQGSVAISQIVLDDPEGGINILGLRPFSLTETAESSNQTVIFNGWTADRDVTRGPSMRTAAARLWDVRLTDTNMTITRRIMRGADANRPAETDVARVQWLLGTTEFGAIVQTSRYVSTLFPVAMDAVDYRDQSNQQILDDCSQQSGKNYFVFYDQPVAHYGLYYDFPGSSKYRSALRLTNILGYVDNDITFGVSETDTKLNRDPSRVYSGVVLPYVGGEVYVQSDAIAAEFIRRDTTAPSVNVKTSAKATARANRYLADATTEADVITTSFLVPLAKVNHLVEGQAVQCRFTHFPGYDQGWNWMRVLKRTVTATSEEYYTIEVEMAAAIGGLLAGGGLTSEGATYPAPVINDPVPLQSCVAANHLTYFYTAGGTRGGLAPATPDDPFLGRFTSTTFLQYWLPGNPGISEYPTAGLVNQFYEGGDALCNVGNSTAGGTANVRITVVGPGTLTVLITAGLACTKPSTATVSGLAYPSGSATPVDTDSQPVGTALTLVIPDDGFCTHYADCTGDGGGFTFESATWSPA
jgi:hypothetical protein